jgi:uncharacterized phage-associated protein
VDTVQINKIRQFQSEFPNMKTPFDINKAAQTAHYFTSQSGGEIDILKLVKLIYLADRKSLADRRTPIVGGSYYSLPHGPITSEILNLINDGTKAETSAWEVAISDRANHKVAVNTAEMVYDALTNSERAILGVVWEKFGTMSKWDIVEWTHKHCLEWNDPCGGREEISGQKLAEAFGWSRVEGLAVEEELEAAFHIQRLINP